MSAWAWTTGGECLLTIDGQPVLDWQIMHRALDELLFGAVRSGGP